LPDNQGRTPLMSAAGSSSSVGDVVAMLLRHGAGVDRKTGWNGRTALMIAAEQGNESAVDALLRAGARRDLKSSEGKTAGDYAVARKHTKIAEKLGMAVQDKDSDNAR